ncbi:hypothetical protein, partial [Nocardioides sp.]|uniref:hypothetical protein n=1 Tax=Nocardioides sp. TaxID=35761 RepID=UPI0027362314
MARHLGMFTSVGALVAASLLVAAPASAVAPANDDFDAAAPLSAGGSSTVDNTEATLEAEEPRPSCNTMVSGSVWYSFTPAANDRFQVDTLDTIGVDTVLAIYEGNTLGGLWEVACNDDSNATASKVVTQLSGGTTYWIQVSNYEWAAAGSI